MIYPENDDLFEDHTVESVDNDGRGITFDGGWGIYVPEDSPVTPTPGMTVRLYGRGIGSPVRGMFLDGRRVYYRTEAEDKEWRENLAYGADAAEWLARWDAGRGVWSVEMGGIGPGYEQAIQITGAEMLRQMLAAKYDPEHWSDADIWKRTREEISAAIMSKLEPLGLSGAQFGAALSLASMIYRHGPKKALAMVDDDRKIQVSKNFPTLAS